MNKKNIGRLMAILMVFTLALGLVRPIQGLINFKVDINKLDAYEVVPEKRASKTNTENNCEVIVAYKSSSRYLCRNIDGQEDSTNDNKTNDYYVFKTKKNSNGLVNYVADKSIDGYDKGFKLENEVESSKNGKSSDRYGIYKYGQGQIVPYNKYTNISWGGIHGTGLDYFFIASDPSKKSAKYDVYNYSGDKLITAKKAFFLREYHVRKNNQDNQGIVYSNGEKDYNVYGMDIHSEYRIINISYHEGKTYGVVEKEYGTYSLVEFQNGEMEEIMEMHSSQSFINIAYVKIDFDHQIVILQHNNYLNDIDSIYSMKSEEPILEKAYQLLDSPELYIFKTDKDEYAFIQNGERVSSLDYNDFKDKLIKNEDEEYIRIKDAVIVFKDEQFEKVIINENNKYDYTKNISMHLADIETYTPYNGIDKSEDNIQFVVNGQRQPKVYDEAYTGRYNDKTVYLARKGDELQLLDEKGKEIARATLRTKMEKFRRFAVLEHENGLAIKEDGPKEPTIHSEVELVMANGNAFGRYSVSPGRGGLRYALCYEEDKGYSIISIDKNYNQIGEPIKLKAEIDEYVRPWPDFDTQSGTFELSRGYGETEYTYLFDESGNLIAQGDEVENYKVKRYEYNSDKTKVTLFNLAGEEVITLNSEDFCECAYGGFALLKLNGKDYVVRLHKYNKEPRTNSE